MLTKSERLGDMFDNCICEAKSRFLCNDKCSLNENDVLVYSETPNGNDVIEINRQQR